MAGFCVRGLRRAGRAHGPSRSGLAAWLFALLCEGIDSGPDPGPRQCLDAGAGGDPGVWRDSAHGAERNGRSGTERGVCRRLSRRPSLFADSWIGDRAVRSLEACLSRWCFARRLVDASRNGWSYVYWVSLADQQSVAQEFPMPATPLSRLSLRIVNRGPDQRPGAAVWRVIEAREGGIGRVLREGRVEVPAGDSRFGLMWIFRFWRLREGSAPVGCRS